MAPRNGAAAIRQRARNGAARAPRSRGNGAEERCCCHPPAGAEWRRARSTEPRKWRRRMAPPPSAIRRARGSTVSAAAAHGACFTGPGWLSRAAGRPTREGLHGERRCGPGACSTGRAERRASDVRGLHGERRCGSWRVLHGPSRAAGRPTREGLYGERRCGSWRVLHGPSRAAGRPTREGLHGERRCGSWRMLHGAGQAEPSGRASDVRGLHGERRWGPAAEVAPAVAPGWLQRWRRGGSGGGAGVAPAVAPGWLRRWLRGGSGPWRRGGSGRGAEGRPASLCGWGPSSVPPPLHVSSWATLPRLISALARVGPRLPGRTLADQLSRFAAPVDTRRRRVPLQPWAVVGSSASW